MCGIAGVISKNSLIDEKRFDNALDRMRHRGPDGSGFVSLGCCGSYISLGHKRLAIIDLSDAGKQPMWSDCGRFVIVFNGEIYNYIEIRKSLQDFGVVFSTNSDTEVLLNAWKIWGLQSLEKLNGMFSFVIVDIVDSNIYAVRDRFGIKPFYYHYKDNEFYFASEVPVVSELIGKSKNIDIDKSINYLAGNLYDVGNQTFYSEINRLPSAHYLKLDLCTFSITINEWWRPSIEQSSVSFAQACKDVKDMLFESVSMHLRSDVEIGYTLSGGLDSSILAYIGSKLSGGKSIQTFSYVEPGYEFNEEKWIRLVTGGIKCKTKFVSQDKTSFFTDIADLIKIQGEPFGSSSIYAQYKVYQSAHQHGIKVVLDGQGADEIFAGYNGYVQYRVNTIYNELGFVSALKFLRNWSGFPNRNLSRAAFSSMLERIGVSSRAFIGRLKYKKFIIPNFVQNPILDKGEVYNFNAGRVLLQKLRSEISDGGLSSLLRHGDRNSMAWSVESRVPYLNKELCEYCFKLPEVYLVDDNGLTKNVLRHSMKGVVPDEILFRKDKVGFETPDFLAGLHDVASVVNFANIKDCAPWLNVDYVTKIIQSSNVNKNLKWRCFNYLMWLNNGL